ncbi:MAG: alpha/beta hydrolase [Alistipes sp.]|nr:alpha/beta hydrolase [Alistipes sp.]
MKRLLLLFFVANAYLGIAQVSQQYTIDKDICYRSDDDYCSKMCLMDIAYRKGQTDQPVIVLFHGGSLRGGKRHIHSRLYRDGAVIVGVDYRLTPQVSVTEIIDDTACAIAWVMDNIEKWGGDPNKIFICGHSAGGYLVTMVGLDKSRLAKYGKDANVLAGIISFSGQAITHFTERRSRGMTNKQPLIDSLAPLYHIRSDAPPMLLMTGDRELEMLGRYEENAYFWRMLRVVGHQDVTLYEFDGYGHNMQEPGYPMLLKFIKEHLNKQNN